MDSPSKIRRLFNFFDHERKAHNPESFIPNVYEEDSETPCRRSSSVFHSACGSEDYLKPRSPRDRYRNRAQHTLYTTRRSRFPVADLPQSRSRPQ